jgi:hypothetical protein
VNVQEDTFAAFAPGPKVSAERTRRVNKELTLCIRTERPLLELPDGIPGAVTVELPAPLARNTSTSSATSSAASSRAASVPADSLENQATIGRKKSVSKSKRKDSSAAAKPHDLAHGAAHLPSHVYSPYHTPIPHCRSAPMSRAPSVTSSSDLSHPPLELPPLPPLPADFEAPGPSPAIYDLPAELDLGPSSSVAIEEFIASLDPNYWPAVPLEAVEGLALNSGVEWPVGAGAVAEEAWPVATSSIGSAGGSEVNYSSTPSFDLGDWPQADSFDLSTEIDKWRQVLVDESSGHQQQLPPLPTNNEWIAPHFTEEPDYSAATSSAPFTPELPFPTSAAFELPRPYLYDEGFFSSSSASSKAPSSVAGSEYSAPLRKASELSLSLVDIDLSLETSGAGAYELQVGDDGYWNGKVDSMLSIPGGAEDLKVQDSSVKGQDVEAVGSEVAC